MPYLNIFNVIDETNKECFDEFLLLNHLRLSQKPMSIDQFKSEFEKKSNDFKYNLPLTSFLFQNREKS